MSEASSSCVASEEGPVSEQKIYYPHLLGKMIDSHADGFLTAADLLSNSEHFVKLLHHKLHLLEEFIDNLDKRLPSLCHESLVQRLSDAKQTDATQQRTDTENDGSQSKSEEGPRNNLTFRLPLSRWLTLFCEGCETCRMLAYQICE